MRKIYGLLILILLSLFLTVNPTAAQTLKPTQAQVDATEDIIGILQSRHYNSARIDNDKSSEILDSYISALDYSRIYFYIADIKEFETYRFSLDDALKNGDLSPAFFIYERYRQRSSERLNYLVKLANSDLSKINFEEDESLEIDRKEAPWIKNRTEMDELWRKRFKSEVLSQKLAGKELDKIQESLISRYSNQLKRLDQTNSEDIFQIYINSLATSYDPHSQYFSPRVSENFKINMSLKLQGIGAMLRGDHEYTKVVRLITGGPAETSGLLKPSDRITGVGQGNDGEIVDVIGWRLDDVVDLIRGPEDSVVRLEVIPAAATDDHIRKIITITRDTVKLEEQAASGKVITINQNDQNYKLGIIDIPAFYSDFEAYRNGDPNYKSTTRDVRKIINDLTRQDIDGIIIDLRNNGGGSLDEVQTLTGLFIKTGPIVQVQYARYFFDFLNKKPRPDIKRDPDPDILYSGPLAVMTNRMSASASEIFAGAIQDYGRGIIIGGQTFGKGTVQQIFPLNRGQIKATSAKYYRISGESTQNRGVLPDIAFPSIYGKDEIGESTYPTALPWDTIESASYQRYGNIKPHISAINELHNARTSADPDFIFLNELLSYNQQLQDRSTISLKESIRRKELADTKEWKLKTVNKRRKAKNQKPLKELAEDEVLMDQVSEESDDDFLLNEAGNILTDLIKINNVQQAVSLTK